MANKSDVIEKKKKEKKKEITRKEELLEYERCMLQAQLLTHVWFCDPMDCSQLCASAHFSESNWVNNFSS